MSATTYTGVMQKIRNGNFKKALALPALALAATALVPTASMAQGSQSRTQATDVKAMDDCLANPNACEVRRYDAPNGNGGPSVVPWWSREAPTQTGVNSTYLNVFNLAMSKHGSDWQLRDSDGDNLQEFFPEVISDAAKECAISGCIFKITNTDTDAIEVVRLTQRQGVGTFLVVKYDNVTQAISANPNADVYDCFVNNQGVVTMDLPAEPVIEEMAPPPPPPPAPVVVDEPAPAPEPYVAPEPDIVRGGLFAGGSYAFGPNTKGNDSNGLGITGNYNIYGPLGVVGQARVGQANGEFGIQEALGGLELATEDRSLYAGVLGGIVAPSSGQYNIVTPSGINSAIGQSADIDGDVSGTGLRGQAGFNSNGFSGQIGYEQTLSDETDRSGIDASLIYDNGSEFAGVSGVTYDISTLQGVQDLERDGFGIAAAAGDRDLITDDIGVRVEGSYAKADTTLPSDLGSSETSEFQIGVFATYQASDNISLYAGPTYGSQKSTNILNVPVEFGGGEQVFKESGFGARVGATVAFGNQNPVLHYDDDSYARLPSQDQVESARASTEASRDAQAAIDEQERLARLNGERELPALTGERVSLGASTSGGENHEGIVTVDPNTGFADDFVNLSAPYQPVATPASAFAEALGASVAQRLPKANVDTSQVYAVFRQADPSGASACEASFNANARVIELCSFAASEQYARSLQAPVLSRR